MLPTCGPYAPIATGALYAAGGSPAKVFRFDDGGKPDTVFDSTDLLAQAIAFRLQRHSLRRHFPDGKVYQVSANGEKSVFFDPKTKYIWDLAFGSDGTLYVATGDKGQIYAVSPDGKANCITPATKPTSTSLPSMPTTICSPAPNPMAVSCASAQCYRERSKNPPLQRRMASSSTKPPNAKSLLSQSAPDGSIYVAAIGEKPRANTQRPNHDHHFTARHHQIHQRGRAPGAAISAPLRRISSRHLQQHLPDRRRRRARRALDFAR